MKIVHLTPYYAPAYAFGGVVRAVEALAQAQAARGHAVTVVTTDAGVKTDAGATAERLQGERDPGPGTVQVLRARNRSAWLRGHANLGTPMGLGAHMRAALAGADVLHAHEFRTLENLIALPAAARAGVPIVLSPHGTLDPTTGRSGLKRLWDRALSPRTARLIAAVAALTEDEAGQVRAHWQALGLPMPPIAVIANGIDAAAFAHLSGGAAFRAQWQIPPAARLILFLGRLHPRKGAHLLAEALGRLKRDDAWLVLAGPDEGGFALVRAQPHTDPARIVVTGYLAGAARLAALAAADLFVLPAVGEGLPLAALEALAAGVPVLVSPECHLPEVAAFGAGVVAAPTVDALAEALASLLAADSARRATMGENARRLARTRFDLKHTAALNEALYATVRLPGTRLPADLIPGHTDPFSSGDCP